MAASPETQVALGVVCERIADGLSMREACKEAGISTKTFCQYLRSDDALGEQYARAREVRSHSNSDKIASVADKVETGELAPDQARVIIDAHKWLAGKWNQREYGDKQSVEVNGKMDFNMAPDVRAAEIARLMAKLKLQEQNAE